MSTREGVLQLYFVFGCVCEVVCWHFMTIFVRVMLSRKSPVLPPLCSGRAEGGHFRQGVATPVSRPRGHVPAPTFRGGGRNFIIARTCIVKRQAALSEIGWSVSLSSPLHLHPRPQRLRSNCAHRALTPMHVQSGPGELDSAPGRPGRLHRLHPRRLFSGARGPQKVMVSVDGAGRDVFKAGSWVA